MTAQTASDPTVLDPDRLDAFVGRVIGDLGATTSCRRCRDRPPARAVCALGRGPATADELAERTGTDARYVAEWLAGQAAGGYVEYDAGDRELPPHRPSRRSPSPTRRARSTCPARSSSRSVRCAPSPGSPRLPNRRGNGLARARRRRLRRLRAVLPPRLRRATSSRLAARPGRRRRQAERRRPGRRRRLRARRVHRCCGAGVPAFRPSSARTTTTARSARPRAGRRGRGRRPGRVRGGRRRSRSRAPATTWSPLRLPARHGRPASARPATSARRWPPTAPGWWSSRSPGTRVEENLNPVGRVYYAFSTLLCVPSALLAARRATPRRAGRRGGDPAAGHRRRVHPLPAASPRPRSTSSTRSAPDRLGERPRSRPKGARRARTRAGHDRRCRAGRRPCRLRGLRPGSARDGRRLCCSPRGRSCTCAAMEGAGPCLARRFRVVTVEGRGNGAGGPPADAAAYADGEYVDDAIAVMDAPGIDRAVVVGLSMGGRHALQLAARYPERARRRGGDRRRRCPGRCRPASPTQRTATRAGRRRTALLARRLPRLGRVLLLAGLHRAALEQAAARTGWLGPGDRRRDLAVHRPRRPRGPTPTPRRVCRQCGARCSWSTATTTGRAVRDRRAAGRWTGGELVTVPGGGHAMPLRDPVRVNLLIARVRRRARRPPAAPRSWTPAAQPAPARAVRLAPRSGSGTPARPRDRRRLRERHPDLEIDWLTQDPVTRVLAERGERVHPAAGGWPARARTSSPRPASTTCTLSRRSAGWTRSSSRTSSCSTTSWRRALRPVVADEGWDVDHFLHENPELKRAAVRLADRLRRAGCRCPTAGRARRR